MLPSTAAPTPSFKLLNVTADLYLLLLCIGSLDRKLKGILEYLRTSGCLANVPLSTSDRLSDDNEDVAGDKLGSTTTLLFSSILDTVFDFSCASVIQIFVVVALTGNVCDFRCASDSHSGSSCGGANLGLLARGGGGGAAFFLRPVRIRITDIIPIFLRLK